MELMPSPLCSNCRHVSCAQAPQRSGGDELAEESQLQRPYVALIRTVLLLWSALGAPPLALCPLVAAASVQGDPADIR